MLEQNERHPQKNVASDQEHCIYLHLLMCLTLSLTCSQEQKVLASWLTLGLVGLLVLTFDVALFCSAEVVNEQVRLSVIVSGSQSWETKSHLSLFDNAEFQSSQ